MVSGSTNSVKLKYKCSQIFLTSVVVSIMGKVIALTAKKYNLVCCALWHIGTIQMDLFFYAVT